jgi:hypothetical protein
MQIDGQIKGFDEPVRPETRGLFSRGNDEFFKGRLGARGFVAHRKLVLAGAAHGCVEFVAGVGLGLHT